MENKNIFINRELSWLRFNSRVLEQSNAEIPILEKLKFLAIYSTNLDEFYMIRVAGLKQLFTAGIVPNNSVDDMTPLDQLRAIRIYLNDEQKILEKRFFELKDELANSGIFIKNYNDLEIKLKNEADEYFKNYIFPVIVPIAVDSTHPFPHLNNLSFSLVLKLCDDKFSERIKFAMLRISRALPRFVQLGANTYCPIESIVHEHAEQIFPGYKLISSAAFRVTRNADMIIEEEEADDFIMILEQGLKLRRKGAFVRMQIQKNADPDLLDFLNQHMKIFHKDIFEYEIPLNLGALWDIATNKEFSHLAYPAFVPKTLAPFNNTTSLFDTIDKEDILIYHPYESFDPVVALVKEAAKDPKVISIRMTLYRVEKSSAIVQALIDAANDGKQVTVMVELKARFDEENNVHWAKELENAGAHVIYGITGFKVHAKIMQIIRKNGDKLKFYMHIATGNYNASSAKIYTDVSYFTSKDEFARDSTAFFHILSGYNKTRKLQTLSMSPMQIKERVLQMIKIEESKKEEGEIIAKMNALVDSDMINALVHAAKNGVKIKLIVRGICCLRPEIKGVSDNIKIVSIVGKYLEHARIFYFKHSKPEFFISSADWMTRNLERRFELMTPIFDEGLKQKLFEILKFQLSDNTLAFELKNSGEYERLTPKDQKSSINSQKMLEDHFSKLYKSYKKDTLKANILVNKLFKES